MDNLSAHKSSKTLDAIQSVGAHVQFLPAYSPDLNPIELMWSKVKGLLRKAQARCPDSLLSAIGMALDKVSARDAAGWFAHCGYAFV
jgi:transposase